MSNELIVRQIDDSLIGQRPHDGFINGTSLCQASGKRINDYWRNQATQEFLEELSRSAGIPADRLVQTVMTGPNQDRGTWVHPDVAIHLAQWCSPRFAVQVSRWVREWLTTGQLRPRLSVYVQRLQYAYDVRMQAPRGYWTVFDQATNLLGKVEISWGYPVEEFDLLDGSVGTCWSRFRQGQPWASADVQYYEHRFPDRRGVRPAKAYLLQELPHFLSWLPDVYERTHLPKYLRAKYPGHRLPGPRGAVPGALA
jgi:hypothetical protein